MVAPNVFVSICLVFLVSRESARVFGSVDDPQSTRKEDEALGDAARYRLSEYAIPDSYELWILPQLALNNFTYEGRVKIDLRLLNETDSVTLNAVGLNIDRARSEFLAISNGTGVKVTIADQYLDTERQFYVITFANNVTVGSYVLELHFVGEVLDDIFGFYRSSYVSGGKTRYSGLSIFRTTKCSLDNFFTLVFVQFFYLQMDGSHAILDDVRASSFSLLRRALHEGDLSAPHRALWERDGYGKHRRGEDRGNVS